ncbi:MAG: HRDC domain-containing protein, partial [Candidatus Cryptobacteroides sp.]
RLNLYNVILEEGFSVQLGTRIATEAELQKSGTLKSYVRRIISTSRAKEEVKEIGGTTGTSEAQDNDTVIEDEVTERLIKTLKAWRKMKYEELHVPAFMVMHQKVLVQIAEERPANKEELMQISGFGKQKWDKYGQEILDIIADSTED